MMAGCKAVAEKAKHPFNKKDYTLADSLNYDHFVIDDLRKIYPGQISIVKAALQFDFENTPDNNDEFDLVRDNLKKKGYLLFRSHEYYDARPDKYTLLKTNNQFEIVKLAGTNGPSYNITTDSVVSRLTAWHTRFPFEITGADHNWVEIKLSDISEEAAVAFAKEINEFCPDIAEHGPETEDGLAIDIQQTKIILLWWD
jgi:hypothetical protein